MYCIYLIIFHFHECHTPNTEFANCTPVDLAEKTNKGSSTELVKGAESAQIPKEPPLIFPKDSSVYKIVENDTALKILQARAAAEKGDPADAESNIDDKVRKLNILFLREAFLIQNDPR